MTRPHLDVVLDEAEGRLTVYLEVDAAAMRRWPPERFTNMWEAIGMLVDVANAPAWAAPELDALAAEAVDAVQGQVRAVLQQAAAVDEPAPAPPAAEEGEDLGSRMADELRKADFASLLGPGVQAPRVEMGHLQVTVAAAADLAAIEAAAAHGFRGDSVDPPGLRRRGRRPGSGRYDLGDFGCPDQAAAALEADLAPADVVDGDPERAVAVAISSARRQVLEHLHDVGGRIEDPHGGATARLADALPRDYSPGGLVQLLRNMEGDGLVRRVVAGKRTLLIEITEAGLNAVDALRAEDDDDAGPEPPEGPETPTEAAEPARGALDGSGDAFDEDEAEQRLRLARILESKGGAHRGILTPLVARLGVPGIAELNGLVDRMAADGLVRRGRHAGSPTVELTEAGEVLLEEAR